MGLGSKRRAAPPTRVEAVAFLTGTAAGFLGLLPGPAGAADPVGLLAWLALLAPAVGFACGAAGVRPWPYGYALPGIWAMLLVWADASSERDLATPFWGALVVAGLFAGCLGLGTLVRPNAALGGAGLVLVLGMLLTGLSVQGGLAAPGTSWGRDDLAAGTGGSPRQRLGALFLELSPLVLAFDCAGWDWTHSHPMVYRESVVEWLPRTPYRGGVAALTLVVVGCTLGEVLTRRSRRRRPPPPSATDATIESES